MELNKSRYAAVPSPFLKRVFNRKYYPFSTPITVKETPEVTREEVKEMPEVTREEVKETPEVTREEVKELGSAVLSVQNKERKLLLWLCITLPDLRAD